MNTGTYLDYIDDLNPSYREVYNKVVLYVGLLDGLSDERKNEKLNDLLDVMLSAQEAGKPVEKVVGRDVRAFCREYCAEYDIRFAVFEVLRGCRLYVWFVLIECLILTLGWIADETARQNSSLFGLTVQDIFINAILIIGLMNFVSVVVSVTNRYMMFGKKLYGVRIMEGIQLLAGVIGIVLMILTAIGKVDCITVPVISPIIPCLIWLGVSYWLEAGLKDYIPEGTLKLFGRTLRHEVPESVDKQFADSMEKKYEDARKKKLERGIDYSMEDFLTDQEQDSRRMLKSKKFDLFLPMVVSVIIMFVAWGTIAADPTTFLILLGVSFVLEVIVVLLVYLNVEQSALNRLAWIRIKRDNMNVKDWTYFGNTEKSND